MASIFKRNGVYYIKFYENGKRVRRSLGTSKRNQALQLKEQVERELANGKYQTERKDTPVEVFWPEYLQWAEAHKQRSSFETESVFWRKLIQFTRPLRLGNVTSRKIEELKLKLLKDGLKPRSVNEALTRLHAIFNHAIKLGYFSGPNPVQGVQRFKIPKNPPKFIQKEEIERVLKLSYARGQDIYLVFALGIYAGLRKNEIVNTRWEWFDFAHKLITLTSHEGFELKDSESRTIPLHDRLAEILLPYREEKGFGWPANRTREQMLNGAP